MKRYEVVYTLEALAELYRYIEAESTAEIALGYTSAVIEYCDGLATFPLRGRLRDDIRPGLRTTTYKRRTDIAYTRSTSLTCQSLECFTAAVITRMS